jgi:hypothetical protein
MDLMIDIETLGTGTNSVVTQIGAVYFDRYTGEVGEKLGVNIQVQDALNLGLVVDAGAIKFWIEQPQCTWLKEPVPVSKALQLLRDFYVKDTEAWSHATFDFPILANMYYTFGQKFPIPYRKLRDIRTLVDLANSPYNVPNKPKTHDAVDDCLYQIEYCVYCFNKLKVTNEQT